MGRVLGLESMGEHTGTATHAEETRSAGHFGPATLKNPRFLGALFAAMLTLQAGGYLTFGTTPTGMGFSEIILCFHDLLALACTWIAFRRARGTAALFWILFAVSLVCLLVPSILMCISTIWSVTLVSGSTWRVLFCLYGAPILMMMFLPETDRPGRQWFQIFLDQFQIAIVIGLAYSTFFYLPLQRLLPSDALVRNLIVSNLQSLFLLLAVLVRLQFARTPASRNLLSGLGAFVVTCATVTLIGNWIDLHGYSVASAWFDLGWALSYLPVAFAAILWRPAPEPESAREPASFGSFLGANLVLVAVLVCLILMLDTWRRVHGPMLTNTAFAVSLIAFTLRLALTQFSQQQEIAWRQAAQDELSIANQTIRGLLEQARIDTDAVTQINEIGTLLQTCNSRADAFRVIPERMVQLFPGTSGLLSILSPSGNRAETAARWGATTLRAFSSRPTSPPARSKSMESGRDSLSIPLIAKDQAIGALFLEWEKPDLDAGPAPSHEHMRRRQLASALAEHVALTISNLDLREALQLQAIRDGLTGLYNRRYMEESLEREIQRALRRERPLALMMVDVDHFKKYNDAFGHAAGDDALRFVAEILIANVRTEDLVCRYGGEEFVVLLPECSLPQAAQRAEEIRESLKRSYETRPGELPSPVTASFGVAAFPETADHKERLLKSADDALYRAKRSGRNCVVVAPASSGANQAATASVR